MKTINIDTWSRKEAYLNFLKFDDPFFNICGDAKVTKLKKFCKNEGVSFFILSYFLVLKTINQIPEFKTRIRGDKVVEHEIINGSCTILRDDETFGYAYFDHTDNFQAFKIQAEEEIQSIKDGKPLDPMFHIDDLIYSSVIPWVSFRSFEHAKRLKKGDSIPKVVFGKLHEVNGETLMPISVSGHHSLMDGLHIGKFFQLFEEYCSAPQKFM